jgi:hypothetical protein
MVRHVVCVPLTSSTFCKQPGLNRKDAVGLAGKEAESTASMISVAQATSCHFGLGVRAGDVEDG